MKPWFLVLALAVTLTAASSAAAQCSCSSDTCSCSCFKKCCVCACTSGGCLCHCVPLATTSLTAGTAVNAAAATVSAAAGESFVVLAGGEQALPSDIKTTPWQAIARLNMVPGVKLGVVVPEMVSRASSQSTIDDLLKPITKVEEIRRLPSTEVVSLCVSEEAGLDAALDSLSRMSGYAFDVSGSPAASFTVKAKGTVQEILTQLSSAAGVTITIAR